MGLPCNVVYISAKFLNFAIKTKPDSLIAQGLPGFNDAKIRSFRH